MPSELQTNSAPTHAGGAVYRMENGVASYLLVRPKSGKNEWLLPKGHIETDEEESGAALREVREETGVIARLICPVETVEFEIQSEIVRVIFFLMEFASQEELRERRQTGWFELKEALQELHHPQSKQIIQTAEKQRLILAARQEQTSQASE